MGTYRFECTNQALFINESLNGLAAAQGRWYGEYLACFMQEERWSNLAKVNVLSQRLSHTSALMQMALGSEFFRSVILYWQYVKNVKQPACVYRQGAFHTFIVIIAKYHSSDMTRWLETNTYHWVC